jgi:hypothetical protein
VSRVAHVSEVIPGLVDQWLDARIVVKAAERAAHPDLADVFGRTWTWVAGELYRHDSMTWTRDMVLSVKLRGPSQDALANANYTWCDRCREVAQP